jgi:hypothetical protein
MNSSSQAAGPGPAARREVKPSGPTVEVGLPDTTSRTKPPHLRAARGMVGLVVNQRGEGNARSS